MKFITFSIFIFSALAIVVYISFGRIHRIEFLSPTNTECNGHTNPNLSCDAPKSRLSIMCSATEGRSNNTNESGINFKACVHFHDSVMRVTASNMQILDSLDKRGKAGGIERILMNWSDSLLHCTRQLRMIGDSKDSVIKALYPSLDSNQVILLNGYFSHVVSNWNLLFVKAVSNNDTAAQRKLFIVMNWGLSAFYKLIIMLSPDDVIRDSRMELFVRPAAKGH